MRKITNYMLVAGQGPNALAAAVKEKIDVGWQPKGNMQVSTSGYSYIQVMVKYEEKSFDDSYICGPD